MFVLVLVCVGRSWRPKTAATATCSFLSTLITSVLQMLLFLPIPSMLNGCDSTTDQMNNYTAAAAALEGGPSEGGGGFESPFYAHTQLQLISTRLGHFKLLLTSYTSQNVLGYSYQRLNAFVCVFQKGGNSGPPLSQTPLFSVNVGWPSVQLGRPVASRARSWLRLRAAGTSHYFVSLEERTALAKKELVEEQSRERRSNKNCKKRLRQALESIGIAGTCRLRIANFKGKPHQN